MNSVWLSEYTFLEGEGGPETTEDEEDREDGKESSEVSFRGENTSSFDLTSRELSFNGSLMDDEEDDEEMERGLLRAFSKFLRGRRRFDLEL